MAKQKKVARLTSQSNSNARGRTAQTLPPDEAPSVVAERKTASNRSMDTTVAGKRRGDRRDMSPTYTTNTKHAARGNNPRADVKTRRR